MADDCDDLPESIQPEERRAWEVVRAYLKAHPGASMIEACGMTRTDPRHYWRALKMIALDREAFDFPDDDKLRPADPIFKKMEGA